MSPTDSDATTTDQLEQSLSDLMHQLEQVEARLAQVSAERDDLLKEMDDLARFLSHDLRAPLRGLDGYSSALLEDYGPKLDSMGLAYLQYIADSTRQAASLIDRLIYFIRLRLADLQIETINLSQLTSELVQARSRSQSDRNISWVIAPDLTTRGDFRMIRELMSILLDNAWKFTSKHLKATIEVGQVQVGNQETFFVRDDGAGFNMDYKDQLFLPFHRLHTGHDFEGAGMSLAIARRIIERHQGRIWGEGGVEQGATFFFTIQGQAIQ